MEIIRGTKEDMMALWTRTDTETFKHFYEGMSCGDVDLLALRDGQNLCGYVYIFWNSIDKDEANGSDRAYICALHLDESYRGQGLSSALIRTAKETAIAKGVKILTIGIDPGDHHRLRAIYHKWGFTRLVKKAGCDYHYLEVNQAPLVYDEAIDLMALTLP